MLLNLLLELSLLDVFWKLAKRAIQAFLVWVIIVPFVVGLRSELRVLVLRHVRVNWFLKGLMVRSERVSWVRCSRKRLLNVRLMDQFLFALQLFLVVVRGMFIFIVAEKVANCCIPIPFFHVI